MPQPCSICTHDARQAIDQALVSGAPNRRIAAQFHVAEQAIRRHKSAHIPPKLAEAQAAHHTAQAIDIMAELQRGLARVNLLFDACDRWLRDADDPTQYDIGPRAHDVLVTYTAVSDGRPLRKKARLSDLLDKTGQSVESAETKYTDPRLLVLRTSAQLQSNLELIAKLIGQLDDRPQINLTISPQWIQIRTVILTALADYPEARASLATALQQVEL